MKFNKKGFTPVKYFQRKFSIKDINFTGFTLIELLIVIGIIAILAAGVIVAINPGRQFAQARDVTREQHINSLHSSLTSYQISNQGWGDLEITDELTEICNTNEVDSGDCADLADISDLVNDEHINQIPVDPQAEGDGTGYLIKEGSIILVADRAETRFIGIGITEDEYAEGGSDFTCGESFTDDRNGQTYETVEIGDQCWMAENLNIGTRIDGNYNQDDNGTIEKYCYNDNSSNCDTYGGLYQWDEMMQYVTSEPNQGICPTGWHIPTDSEWHTLEDYLTDDGNTCDGSRGGYDCDPAGGKLKEAGTTHWDAETCGAATCNSSGFTALGGGYNELGPYCYNIELSGYWWTSSPESSSSAFNYSLEAHESTVFRSEDSMDDNGYSVRCLKD